ncbi:MAG TPA: ATP-dependent 6-phosphofructokinase [Gemmatimonadales bacterium]|nr:ATP-dependent 6-phosphofructokinase [Gemmatimonadales bacterium]
MTIKRVAVLTSGGDAPGMNAAIRAVVRVGSARGAELVGVRQGFSGLLGGQLQPLGARDVAGIIHTGGTMLGSDRSTEFRTPAGLERARGVLRDQRIDGIVVIGGNGSLSGAHALSKTGFPVVGVASTIDNDVNGADITIGVDTALNIALEAIDRLKTTASSHQRAFVVEVMGRDSGYLALMAGIAGGADVIVIPEVETHPEDVSATLLGAYTRGKRHAMVVVAEGACWNAAALESYFTQHREQLGFELRGTILGHVQRGGAPGAFDRLLASRAAAAAVDRLLAGEAGIFIALVKGAIAALPLERVLAPKPPPDPELVTLAQLLAR